MWPLDQIEITLEDSDDAEGNDRAATVLIRITVPIGEVWVIGVAEIVGQTLEITAAHVGGLTPGALGRAGINAICRKMLEVVDVQEIVIQGSTRTTGRKPGKVPRRFKFPAAKF